MKFAKKKFGVIVFPGSNCDRDIAYSLRDILKQPTHLIWHEDSDLGDVDVVVEMPPDLFSMVHLKAHLQESLQVSVDLVRYWPHMTY